MDLVISVVFILVFTAVCEGGRSLKDRKIEELFGFQDVMAHLSEGYKVSFFMSGTDCNDPSSLPGDFHEPFGGNINFYFQYKQNGILTAQFTMSKFERNSSGNLVTILRQAFLTEQDEAHWMVSVLSADKSKALSTWSFTCQFGNNTRNNVLRFYADETSPPEQLHSVADVKAALVSGKQIHYSAMLFLCSGDAPWEAAGGHIKDFDIVSENSQTLVKSTLNALVRDTAAIQSEYIVVTSTLHDNRVVNFEISDNEALTFKSMYEGQKSCYMQTTMPGGTVNYYIV